MNSDKPSPYRLTRRTFLGTATLGALSWPQLMQGSADDLAATGRIVMPTANFGSIRPEEVGIHADVTTAISTYLQSQVDAKVIPGAFVAAIRNGKVFLEQHFGVYCNRTVYDAPYDGAAIHPFHSISKMVSATAIVMAWQDGLIDIDAPIIKYVPEFKGGGKDEITIRQLLAHSAGIPQYPPQGIKTGTEEEWKASIAAVCAQAVQWPPESRTEYHALSGLLMAAEAVRRVSNGKTWQQICQERIFIPLNLPSLTFDQPPLYLPLAVIPRLQNPTKGWPVQIDHFLGAPGAGLKGTLTDVLKFLRFQSQKCVWQGKTLLQEKYWTEMHRPQFPPGKPGFDSWGLGMLVRGTGPSVGMLSWFGIRDVTGPHIFSHAGTDVFLAVGDPETDIQIIFIATDTPSTKEKVVELRNTVTSTIFKAVSPS